MSLLEISALRAGYQGVPVIHELSLSVSDSQLVTVIGANGAGKSTLLKVVSGVVPAMSGAIHFDGQEITKWSPTRRARAGIAHVPENRRVFGAQSIEDNLLLGSFARRVDRSGIPRDLDDVFARFPILGRRRKSAAGLLSGGEQQMLAIGMALMARPRLLILDEPSLGLAPLVVKDVYSQIRSLKEGGMTILLVEQLANVALGVADRGAVLQLGVVTLTGTAEELRVNEAVKSAYL